MPGVIIPFVKQGAFAWSGVFGFWVVAIGFFSWVLVNYVMTVKAIKGQLSSMTSEMTVKR